MRAAFSADQRFDSLRQPSALAAVLGTVTHDLEESVAKGAFRSLSDEVLRVEVEAWWDRRVEAARATLVAAATFGQPPAPARWPFYTRKRRRAITRAVDRLASRGRGAGGARPGVETWLESDVPPLKGKIDRIERVGGSTTIVDVKTSLSAEVSIDQRQQLLFYAALLRAAEGEEATTLAVEYVLEQHRESFACNWDEVDAFVDGVIALSAEVSEAGGDRDGLASLARPSPVACGRCDFQAVCGPHAAFVDETWSPYDRFVVGAVTGLETTRTGSAVSLRVLKGSHHAQGDEVVFLTWPASVSAPRCGALLAVSGAERTQDPSTIRGTWDTRAREWK